MQKKFKEIFNIENRTKYFNHVLVFLFLVSVTVFVFTLATQESNKNIKLTNKKNNNGAFQNIDITAKSAVVIDVINKTKIFSKNSSEPLPLASLTKVMTALVVSEILEKDENIKITREYLKPEGDSGLVVGDIWKAKDLRDFTLITSSNDGALALATLAEFKNKTEIGSSTKEEFIKEMNNKALKIGMVNSVFFNEHGLDKSMDRGGAYGSAEDVATLFEHVIKNYPEIIEATKYKNIELKSLEKKYNAENTNIFVNKIPNLIASKTGYTDLAGGNLVIAFDVGLNRPIIISVLGSTQEGRFEDALKLVNASIEYINKE